MEMFGTLGNALNTALYHTRNGFAYLKNRLAYHVYGPHTTDDRAYVSPVFEIPDPPEWLDDLDEPKRFGEVTEHALKGYFGVTLFPAIDNKPVPYNEAVKEVIERTVELIKGNIAKHNNIKVSLRANCYFENDTSPVTKWVTDTAFEVNKYISDEILATRVKESFEGEDGLPKSIKVFMEAYKLSLLGVTAISVHMSRNPSRKGGSYLPSPDQIKAKHGYINVNNSEPPDHFCFKYAVCVALYRQEVSKKMRRPELSKPKVWEKFFDKLDWRGIEFPTSVEDVDTFEKNNEKINIHVWALEEDKESVHVVRKSTRKVMPGTRVIDLLMLCEGECNHFTTILNIGKFRRSGKNCTKYPCLTCSKLLNSKKLLAEHTRLGCNIARDGAVETMPRKYSHMMFESKNNKKTNHHPYVVYADFESLLIKVPKDDPRYRKGHRKIHEVSAYCILQLIWSKKHGDEVFKTVTKTRKDDQSVEDFMQEFMTDLKEVSFEAYRYFCKNERAVITPEDEKAFTQASHCCLCKKAFKKDGIRHRHHEHTTGLYLGPAHPNCNLTCNDWYFTNPVFFHNLKSYDSHHILAGLGNAVGDLKDGDYELGKLTREKIFDGSLSAISESAEKLKCITWKPDYSARKTSTQKCENPHITIDFKDSLAFMDSSLEDLVEALKATEEALRAKNPKKHVNTPFRNLHQYVKGLVTKDHRLTIKKGVSLLKRKGVMCYDYIDSLNALSLDHLPPIESFYNKLKDRPCPPEDYKHAQEVWKYFKCRTVKDYQEIYVATDVALLADVFQSFREMCHKYYKLDPAVFVSSPQMFTDAMLLFTNVKLDLLHDMEMYKFFEQAKRGGTTFLNEHYMKANNKYIDGYDPKKPSIFLIDEDENNLYGDSMSRSLPTGNFSWVAKGLLDNLPSRKIADQDKTGYTLEIDMHLPPEHHKKLKDFPPVCERTIISASECSPNETVHIQPRKTKLSDKTLEDVVDNDPLDSQSLLVNHLKPVKNYVVNLQMLQLQMQLGYFVTKVHRAISYDQSPWLRPYIEFNTAKRREAKLTGDKFLSNFFKLANNAVYGRTMMNVREFSDYRFAYNQDSAFRYVTDSAFKGAKIINENLVGLQMQKKEIFLNQPIFLGVTILDYSKMVMVDFYHNKMRKF